MGLIPLFTNGIEPDDVELDLYLAELDDELNTAASKPNEVRDGYCGDEDKVAALPSVASEPTGKAVAKPTAKYRIRLSTRLYGRRTHYLNQPIPGPVQAWKR